jgi:catechol 2,3-dioxygenase-like lactoylglutathione lyase family enzyme
MSLQAIDHAVIICPDLAQACAAYVDYLDQTVHRQEPLDSDYARKLGLTGMDEAASAWLGIAGAAPWLLLVQSAIANVPAPFTKAGWMALELAVRDVDALASSLQAGPFKIIAAPKDLDFSDAIRAMQVQGPAGEVLYLTQIKRAVPPFRLPQTKLTVDGPFVAILGTEDLGAASAFYLGLGADKRLRFNTRLGALNQARGLAPDTQHTVATVELSSGHLLEIDAPNCTLASAMLIDGTEAGIACVVLSRTYRGDLRALRGMASELIGLQGCA